MDGGDIEMAAADDGASAPEVLDAMRKRLKEIEDEVAALRELQAKVEKEMGAVQDPNAATVSQANKKEVDSRSIFVGNDINMDCENALWNGNIPLDLVKDILLRLPAKALGRCMCTCKRLYSLIKSTQFMTSHFNRSKIRDNTILIVQEGCYSVFSESDTTLTKQESGRIPFPVMESDLYILGSCRGLLLVRLKVSLRDLVLLWNPLLEKFKLVDSIIHDRPHGNARAVSSWLCVYGLGFHEASNDYRVVRITHGDVVDVYSFTNDNWHRVYETTNGKTLPSIANPTKMAIYVNGAVHWLASYNKHNLEENMVAIYNYDPEFDERFVILSFDFDIGFLKVIDLPPRRDCPYDYRSYALEVKEFNQKLALFGFHPSLGEFYYTWVMMNYPLAESWTNNGCLFKHGMDTVWPLVCTKKENCISKYNYAVKKDMLMYFNTKEDKIYELEVSAPYECPVIVDFVDNLVLLDIDNEVLEDHAL